MVKRGLVILQLIKIFKNSEVWRHTVHEGATLFWVFVHLTVNDTCKGSFLLAVDWYTVSMLYPLPFFFFHDSSM